MSKVRVKTCIRPTDIDYFFNGVLKKPENHFVAIKTVGDIAILVYKTDKEETKELTYEEMGS